MKTLLITSTASETSRGESKMLLNTHLKMP